MDNAINPSFDFAFWGIVLVRLLLGYISRWYLFRGRKKLSGIELPSEPRTIRRWVRIYWGVRTAAVLTVLGMYFAFLAGAVSPHAAIAIFVICLVGYVAVSLRLVLRHCIYVTSVGFHPHYVIESLPVRKRAIYLIEEPLLTAVLVACGLYLLGVSPS